jgi:adenylate cyclase
MTRHQARPSSPRATSREGLDPQRLVGELNAYLEAMVSVIDQEGGIVDKYIGDAIMVVFGIPGTHPDDADRAVRTATRMREALVQHNQERVEAGLDPLREGIGVHFGHAVAGNIGTAERLQYTAVGDVPSSTRYGHRDPARQERRPEGRRYRWSG